MKCIINKDTGNQSEINGYDYKKKEEGFYGLYKKSDTKTSTPKD